MHRRSLLLLSVLLAAPPGAAAAPCQGLRLDRVAAVADSLAQAQIASGAIPGMSVAVARDGEIVFEKGYGTADVEMGVPATARTVYGITSISKQFTAALLLRLVEAGRISLDDPVTTHLPDFPVQGRAVTVRHLLNHTSGIFALRGSSVPGQDPQWYKRDYTYAEMVERFGAQPFEFEPGERHAYNNFAYYLLGEIIARVTGTPFAEHVSQELAPLGLGSTTYCDQRRVVPGRGEAYLVEDGRITHAPHVSLGIFGGGGALCSTAGDLVRWSHLLHGGRVVSPALLREMTARAVLAGGDSVDYGYGVYLGDLEGRRKVYHGGTQPWGAYLARYPDAGLTIAVLTNSARTGRERAEEMEEALAREVFGLVIPDLPLTAAQIAGYEGTYTLRMGERTLEVRVFGEDGQLRAHPAGQGVLRLLHQGGHAFVAAQDDGIRLVFTVQDGRATGITLHQRGRAISGERNP